MSRRRRRGSNRGPKSPPPKGFPGWLIIFLILAVVTLVAAIPYVVASRDARRPASEQIPITVALPPNVVLSDLQLARVADVIDGDTIRVSINGELVTVRYFGVAAPERGDRCFREAADRNRILIGTSVLLLKDRRVQDRFGRELRYVFLSSGVSVDATLVAEGFARAWREDGYYRDEIVSLEEQAREAGRGCLWRSAALSGDGRVELENGAAVVVVAD
jgi:endonuclease YncB( thermonuclease family)